MPLYIAVVNGAFYISRLLISLNISVETADNSGKLPLIKAVITSHLEILKLLLKAGSIAID
jgi:ankyrin repeat protein